MKENLAAKTQMAMRATPREVWKALTTPELVKKYMQGAEVKSTWTVGASLVYRGEHEGKPFEDKGVIQKIEKDKLLQTTHFSATSGEEETPENSHMVTWELREKGKETIVTVSQDNLSDEDGVAKSRASWSALLKRMKTTVEAREVV